MTNKIYGIFFLFLISFPAYAQEKDTIVSQGESEFTDKIENIAESTNAALDYTELIEDLRYYRSNPLNLNFATEDELRKLMFLNNKQIYQLVAYRETYGQLVSIYELQAIEGFDENTIQNILPFVMVSSERPARKLNLKNVFKYGNHQLIGRYQQLLQKPKGYEDVDDSTLYESPNSYYLGGREKIYTRYGFNYQNRIRFGITAEKDAGEVFLSDNVNDSIKKLMNNDLSSGFDFYSAHFMISDVGKLKALAIGDYQLRFGQGLTMWSALAFGKTSDAVNIKRFSTGIRPYTSADENRFFRGAATTWQFGLFDISAFYSSNKIDATLKEPLLVDEQAGASLYENGFHRKISELDKKDALLVDVYGGNITFRKNRLKIGATGYYSKYDLDLTNTQQLYNRFALTGSDNANYGLDYSYLFSKATIFGEVAMSENGGYAMIHGISATIHPRFSTSLSYRDYSKDYQNVYSNAFAESQNYNERGFYSGFRFDLAKKWSLSAYYDFFKFPWLKFGVNSPSQGNELLMQFDHRMSETVFMYFRFRQKSKQYNYTESEDYIKPIENIRKTAYRFHIEYAVGPSVVMKNRAEFLLNRGSEGYRGSGYLLLHDINWNTFSGKLKLYFRYALFDTDSYDERMYAYENDVLYAFSVPAYYYKGSKGVIMARYKIGDFLNVWLRLSHTWFANQQTLGSGPDLIDGNEKTEVKVQLQVKL